MPNNLSLLSCWKKEVDRFRMSWSHYIYSSSSVQEFIDEGCILSEEDSKILQEAKFQVKSPVRQLKNGAHAKIVQREVLQDGSGIINRVTPKVCDYLSQTLVAADSVVVVISMTNYMVLEEKGEELIAQELDGHHQLSK